jgi:hypothetical protein
MTNSAATSSTLLLAMPPTMKKHCLDTINVGVWKQDLPRSSPNSKRSPYRDMGMLAFVKVFVDPPTFKVKHQAVGSRGAYAPADCIE